MEETTVSDLFLTVVQFRFHTSSIQSIGMMKASTGQGTAHSLPAVKPNPFAKCTTDQKRFFSYSVPRSGFPSDLVLEECTNDALTTYYDQILYQFWDRNPPMKVHLIFSTHDQNFEKLEGCAFTMPEDHKELSGQWFRITRYWWKVAAATWPHEWTGTCLKSLDTGQEAWYWRFHKVEPSGGAQSIVRLGQSYEQNRISIRSIFESKWKDLEIEGDWKGMNFWRNSPRLLIESNRARGQAQIRARLRAQAQSRLPAQYRASPSPVLADWTCRLARQVSQIHRDHEAQIQQNLNRTAPDLNMGAQDALASMRMRL
ncbi:hypothetical protein BJ508DRAFT_311079 [Ascobolus immersus RN42]|uniref:Uncharacterized protein n=1 Tax=Ascobolus immersus RN42 TaxID=1160509 RepID=A0A3N4I3L5_ASCIM|nr:hypothetical protein BJ508DRAFT_311079 [Ascobolus immersus RN42]